MYEPPVSKSAAQLKKRLTNLRNARRMRQARQRAKLRRRQSLTTAERAIVLEKTHKRCHICGGKVPRRWQADHVFAYGSGG